MTLRDELQDLLSRHTVLSITVSMATLFDGYALDCEEVNEERSARIYRCRSRAFRAARDIIEQGPQTQDRSENQEVLGDT